MRYYDHVTFQAPTETRLPSGAVVLTYENVPTLIDVPAKVTAVLEEERGERTVIITDRYDVLLAGEHDEVDEEMVLLDGEAVYDVIQVQPFALGRRGRRSTRVITQRVAI